MKNSKEVKRNRLESVLGKLQQEYLFLQHTIDELPGSSKYYAEQACFKIFEAIAYIEQAILESQYS